jgi:hypothetical protein
MGMFFKTETDDANANNVFFMTLLTVIRENPTRPNFNQELIIEKFNNLLAVKNEKPASHHITSIRACCSLLSLETASKEFIEIARRANTASLANNLSVYKTEYDNAQQWMNNHCVSLTKAPTMDDILASLRGK